MVILVIGPSGVGKTTYGRHVEEVIPECQFFDIDRLVHKRWNKSVRQQLHDDGNNAFFKRCQQVVDGLLQHCNESVGIAALGAGALQSDLVSTWLSNYPDPTIAIVADPDEVYRRGKQRNQNRTFEQFREMEYSQRRKDLYNIAQYQCYVSKLSLEEAKHYFADMIRNILIEETRGLYQVLWQVVGKSQLKILESPTQLDQINIGTEDIRWIRISDDYRKFPKP